MHGIILHVSFILAFFLIQVGGIYLKKGNAQSIDKIKKYVTVTFMRIT